MRMGMARCRRSGCEHTRWGPQQQQAMLCGWSTWTPASTRWAFTPAKSVWWLVKPPRLRCRASRTPLSMPSRILWWRVTSWDSPVCQRVGLLDCIVLTPPLPVWKRSFRSVRPSRTLTARFRTSLVDAQWARMAKLLFMLQHRRRRILVCTRPQMGSRLQRSCHSGTRWMATLWITLGSARTDTLRRAARWRCILCTSHNRLWPVSGCMISSHPCSCSCL
mmetsp:Transcript_35253/g.77138  ORF Transcript_35253/g.77138 Transcript_35253/m.77138 type:complete len:220 (-) Transcript_35253:131-790(-)